MFYQKKVHFVLSFVWFVSFLSLHGLSAQATNKTEPPKKEETKPAKAPDEKFWDSVFAFEGWGGDPREVFTGVFPGKSEIKDYYYTRVEARGVEKFIQEKKFPLVEATCRATAKSMGSMLPIERYFEMALKKIKVSNKSGRAYIAEENGVVKQECKFENQGDVKVTSCSGSAKTAMVNCRMKSTDTSNSDYGSCICVVASRFLGGEEALIKSLRVE